MITLFALTLTCVPTIDVLRVHPTQGPYTEIRDAVGAAAPGDVVIVEPGSYGHFGVIGKGLTVVSRLPGSVFVQGVVRVQFVPAGETVALSGFHVTTSATQAEPGLYVYGNAGAVRVEDSQFQAGHHYGISVHTSEDVLLHGCTATSSSSSGLWSVGSTLSIHGGTYRGASFDFGQSNWGYSGGDGITLYQSALFASKVQARGGNGGDEYSPGFYCGAPGGAGGDGIFGADSTIEVIDSDLRGGSAPLPNVCPSSPWGQPVDVVGASTVTMHPGVAVELGVSRDVAVEGDTFFVQANGAAGMPTLLLVGPEARRTDLPGTVGDLLVGGSLGSVRRLDLGAAPASRQLVAPSLPPFGVVALHLQAAQVTPSGLVFGPAQVLNVIDSAW